MIYYLNIKDHYMDHSLLCQNVCSPFLDEISYLQQILTFLSQSSSRVMQGAAIQEELKNGNAISTELLVDIIVSAIR